jgi:hypothetical protein
MTCCNAHSTSSIQLLTVTSSRQPSLSPCPTMSTLRYPPPHFCASPSTASLLWLRRTEARPCSHKSVVGGLERRRGSSWSAWRVRPPALRRTTDCMATHRQAKSRQAGRCCLCQSDIGGLLIPLAARPSGPAPRQSQSGRGLHPDLLFKKKLKKKSELHVIPRSTEA